MNNSDIDAEIDVFNISGVKVGSTLMQLSKGNNAIDIRFLEKRIYIVKIRTKTFIKSFKFIKA